MTPAGWFWTGYASCLAVIGAAILFSCDAKGAERIAKAPQSREPWALAQCDKLWIEQMKSCRPATAVFNRSLWNQGGWPLWGPICVWKEKVR